MLYSPGVTARYGSGVDTRINHLVNASNDAYRRSEAGLRIRVVDTLMRDVDVATSLARTTLALIQSLK